MDYTNLNEAYSKESFPLPRIDHIVDVSAGHGMLSFLEAFSGYHQIPMHPPDAEKTTFITSHGLLCYNVMSFGLQCRGKISEVSDKDVQVATRKNHRGLH